MSTAGFARLKSIFARAVEVPEHEVAAFLDEACQGDRGLRNQVEELLRQASSPDTTLLGEVVAAKPPHALALGTTLANRFRLLRYIGRGGMGEVYLAEDLELGGRVALKTVRGGLLDAQGLARFRREVQLSRQVTHTNICRVFDVGRETVDGQDLVFLTMEYLEGQTLGQYLSAYGKISPEMAEPLIRQLAAGLDALHAKGIMHRDLKPANVMLAGSHLSIMDFGLARAFEGEGSDDHHTQTGTILGTPGYMAPEQLMGETATAASDIYTMGLLIFEMLTGLKASMVDNLSVGKTGLPERWEAVVLRCVARDKSSRPQSAGEAIESRIGHVVAAPLQRQWKGWQVAVLGLALAGAAIVPFAMREKPGKNLSPADASANDKILRARELLVRYYKPKNVSEAMGILEQVVKENPNLALGHASLGAAIYRQFADTKDVSLLDRAKEACAKAIQLDPEMASPHVTLGLLYTDTGRHDLAGSELKMALQLDSRQAEVHFALAQLYRATGRNAEKAAEIQKAIDLAPDNWSYRNWRSTEFRDQGKYVEAIEELQAAAKLMPENPLIYNNLGVTYTRLRKFAEARIAYERSIELEPRARTIGNLAAVFYMEEQYGKAAETFEKALALDPQNYLLWANFAAALDRNAADRARVRGAYLKAIELADALASKTPNDEKLLSDLASYQAFVGNREQAIARIRRATLISPENSSVANRAVEVYELLKDRDEALKWVGKALQLGYSLESLKTNPELAGLCADLRFKDIARKSKEKTNEKR